MEFYQQFANSTKLWGKDCKFERIGVVMKLIILAAPGAGKGTQAELLSKHFNIPTISTGAILRKNISDGTRLGEIAAAIIEVKQGMTCTEDEINEFCMELPRYKRPRKIIFADVPRNPTGKIEKPKLRKIYGAEGLVDSQNKS